MHGARLQSGSENSHDKTMRLALTCGYRVFVCSKHGVQRGLQDGPRSTRSRLNSLLLFVGVDRMQGNLSHAETVEFLAKAGNEHRLSEDGSSRGVHRKESSSPEATCARRVHDLILRAAI